MALVTNTVGPELVTILPAAAPTTSETISSPGDGVYLEFTIGATATTVTLNRYGVNVAGGDPEADLVLTAATSISKMIQVGRDYINPATGNAVVDFSQVTAVTARLFRFAG